MVYGNGLNSTGFSPFNHDVRKATGQQNAERGKRVRIEFEEALEEFIIIDSCTIYVKSD